LMNEEKGSWKEAIEVERQKGGETVRYTDRETQR
jgi:hypothetical protein